jgi:hypothetical protein
MGVSIQNTNTNVFLSSALAFFPQFLVNRPMLQAQALIERSGNCTLELMYGLEDLEILINRDMKFSSIVLPATTGLFLAPSAPFSSLPCYQSPTATKAPLVVQYSHSPSMTYVAPADSSFQSTTISQGGICDVSQQQTYVSLSCYVSQILDKRGRLTVHI